THLVCTLKVDSNLCLCLCTIICISRYSGPTGRLIEIKRSPPIRFFVSVIVNKYSY
ncbi:hypothetical protein FRX31_019086, partial [Thalictrum thalictroides]